MPILQTIQEDCNKTSPLNARSCNEKITITFQILWAISSGRALNITISPPQHVRKFAHHKQAKQGTSLSFHIAIRKPSTGRRWEELIIVMTWHGLTLLHFHGLWFGTGSVSCAQTAMFRYCLFSAFFVLMYDAPDMADTSAFPLRGGIRCHSLSRHIYWWRQRQTQQWRIRVTGLGVEVKFVRQVQGRVNCDAVISFCDTVLCFFSPQANTRWVYIRFPLHDKANIALRSTIQ